MDQQIEAFLEDEDDDSDSGGDDSSPNLEDVASDEDLDD
jgi:hypothetical protein